MSEPRRLGVGAPLVFQHTADLAESCLGANRVEHDRDHVVGAASGLDKAADRRVYGGTVAPGPALTEHLALGELDFVRDAKDLQWLLNGFGVDVDADDALVTFL